MSDSSLYEKLGFDFQPEKRQSYLDELAYVAEHYKTALGSEDQTKEPDRPQQNMRAIAANFKNQEVVELAPHQAFPLDEKLFAELNVGMSPNVKSLLQQFNFYKVDFPIVLKSPWGFSGLYCSVQFNPERPERERPVAHQIFPDQEWQTILHAWQGLEVGLDTNLEFKLAPAALEVLSQIKDAALKASIESKIASQSGLILGPFNYYIRRPKITTKGRDFYQVWWDLIGEDQITQTEPRLGVILKVPKNIQQVDVKAELLVVRSTSFSTLLHDLWDLLSTPAQNFFKSGAPVWREKEFSNITASASAYGALGG
jgi:hypothetical protein